MYNNQLQINIYFEKNILLVNVIKLEVNQCNDRWELSNLY